MAWYHFLKINYFSLTAVICANTLVVDPVAWIPTCIDFSAVIALTISPRAFDGETKFIAKPIPSESVKLYAEIEISPVPDME